MSCDWGYRCKKDGAETETWFNHGETILRSIVECYPLIEQLQEKDKSGFLEVHILGHAWVEGELWDFLREHLEHGIELLNEYGESAPLKEE